jgi:hypothetical protein
MSNKFESFSEFYPFYLDEHRNVTCRRLHFVGTFLVIALLFWTVWSNEPVWLLLVPLVGYGFAWVGHFVFEKNRPATFQYPLYSLLGDFVMFRDILTGRIKI